MNYMLSSATSRAYKAKEQIISNGTFQKELFYMTSGLVRGYYVNDSGAEITTRFINENGWITHYTALISNEKSKYTFQTLELSEVLVFPFEKILNGYSRYPSLEKIGRLIAESVLKTQQKRIESFQFLDAEKRYLEFVSNYPDLFNRVSLSHLSTYLGIQRQSLSRIRRKIVRK